MPAVNMVADDGLSVDRTHWSEAQAGVIKAAAEEPEVDRIFVNAAIKRALCERHKGEPWMNRVRAYWGTTTTSTFASNAPTGTRTASRKTRCLRATAVTSRSTGGSPTRRSIHAPDRRSRR